MYLLGSVFVLARERLAPSSGLGMLRVTWCYTIVYFGPRYLRCTQAEASEKCAPLQIRMSWYGPACEALMTSLL